MGVSQVLGECDRLRGHPQLLHRPGAPEALVTLQERRRVRVLQYHQDIKTVQAHKTFFRIKNSTSDFQVRININMSHFFYMVTLFISKFQS